jgi:hypothetical protein
VRCNGSSKSEGGGDVLHRRDRGIDSKGLKGRLKVC